MKIADYLLEKEEELGRGHYLRLRRVHLRNQYEDGTLSAPYFCELVDRPNHGTDAVVVGLWRRNPHSQTIEVLLRKGLRPALRFGRAAAHLAGFAHAVDIHVVARIEAAEEEDRGIVGIRRRAVAEAWEEAGVRLQESDLEFLGQRTFPSPGMTPEAFFLVCAEVKQEPLPPTGDGSPMEQGALVRWLPLEQALLLCERGEIEDAKTELLLHRLQRRLQHSQQTIDGA